MKSKGAEHVIVEKKIDIWLRSGDNPSGFDEIKPSDSVSNIGSRDSHSGAVVSRKSRSKRSVTSSGLSSRNSAMSARVIAAAKKAVLEAEATQLENRQFLQNEELRLKQMKEKILTRNRNRKSEG